MTSLWEMRRFVRCAPVFVLNQIRIWMKYSNRFCVSKWSLKVEREIKAPTSMNVSLAWKLFSSVLFFMQKISSKSRNFNSIFSWRTFPWETKTVWFKILTGGSEASIKKTFLGEQKKIVSTFGVLPSHGSGHSSFRTNSKNAFLCLQGISNLLISLSIPCFFWFISLCKCFLLFSNRTSNPFFKVYWGR